MPTYKGILSFPALFTPKIPKGATEPRYSLTLLFPPGDADLARAYADFKQAERDAYPSGIPRTADVCMMNYREKYQGKDYYDPALAEWWVLSCTAKPEDKPKVVDMSHQPIVDPGHVGCAAGAIVYVNLNMSGYTKGTGGIGGWLNGVMVTGEMGSLGRLDNKPSVEQMFADVPGVSRAPAGIPPAPGIPGTATAPPAPPAPPAAGPIMTAAAKGVPYADYIKAGWNDELLIQHGMMIKPSFA